MSSGGLKRTAACRRVMPLSSEHDDIALAMFRHEAGLERTDDRKVFQSWTMMSSTMSPMELNMVDNMMDWRIVVDCGYSLSLAVIPKCQSGFVEGNVAWCFSKEYVVVLDLSLSLSSRSFALMHVFYTSSFRGFCHS